MGKTTKDQTFDPFDPHPGPSPFRGREKAAPLTHLFCRVAFSPAELKQLEKLAALPDDEIDTSDIPETPEESWIHARRGAFYRPVKQPVTIRLDADVLDWFKRHAEGRGYQIEINRVLRRHVMETEKRRVGETRSSPVGS
jgi:uncharacterized protein (DUF4415 family)